MTTIPSIMTSCTPDRLQQLANLAVVAASVAVIWFVWDKPARDIGRAEGYAVEDPMDPIDGVDFARNGSTLLMMLREDCRFCQESIPFYKRLTTAVAHSASPHRIVVVSTDPLERMSAYLGAAGVQVSHLAGVTPGQLRVPGTPMLLLVDNTGVVREVWRGKLNRAQEVEVLRALDLSDVD